MGSNFLYGQSSLELDSLELMKVLGDYQRNGGPLWELDFEKPVNSNEAIKDYQILLSILQKESPNLYRYRSQAGMDSLFAQHLTELSGTVNYLDFTRIIARTFNEMGCGHSGWSHSKEFRRYRDKAMTFFPLQIISINDRYYVQNAGSNSMLKPGDEIIKINGSSPSQLNAKFRKFMYRDGTGLLGNEDEISNYFQNAYSNFIDNPATFHLVVQYKDSDLLEVDLKGLTKEELKMANQVESSRSKSRLPLEFEYVDSMETGIYTILWFQKEYIQSKGQSFENYTDSVFQFLEESKGSNLIIDLRDNPGGWTAYGKYLLRYLVDDTGRFMEAVYFNRRKVNTFDPLVLYDPEMEDSMELKDEGNLLKWVNYPNQLIVPMNSNRFKGKVWVLINENSRSCSAVTASALKRLTDAEFLGQQAGGAQGEQGGFVKSFQLPYSGVLVHISTARYIMDGNIENALVGVQPDYLVTYKYEEKVSGIDKEMKLVFELIKEQN